MSSILPAAAAAAAAPDCVPQDTLAQSMASGTQDIAALSALLFSGSVERNAIATHLGLGNLSISQLSLLGMLGMVKSALKIALGNDRCQAAGFGLESLRGIFGYTALEAESNALILECDVVRVEFEGQAPKAKGRKGGDLVIKKWKRFFNAESNPLLDVASRYGTDQTGRGGLRLTGFTALNLGNPTKEGSWGQSICLHLLFGILCTGITSWLLIVVQTSWSWVRIHAMVGMHASLLVLFAMPLLYTWKTQRPGTCLTIPVWDALSAWKSDVRTMELLQCRLGHGDVLHAQGKSLFLHGWPTRIIALLAALCLVVAYICQYSILRDATNQSALLWLALQAVAALIRSVYWLSAPKDGSPSKLAEFKEYPEPPFVLIRNSAPKKITLAELICACKTGETRIPLWAWTYIRDTPIEDIVLDGANRGPDDIIPLDAEWYAFEGQDFNRIIRGRLPYALPNHTHHGICLGLWRSKVEKAAVHPFFLVVTKYLSVGQSALCHMEANSSLYYTGNSCNYFAFDSSSMERLHIRPFSETNNCCRSCKWGERTPDCEHKDTARFLLDRAHRGGGMQRIMKRAWRE
ncbi:hypothetical protein BU16DRAFT_579389 [Lophium mytilinum]|uniref:Uncharacterized protein n=1 Tax=Lophium mytilinum TaxID=390894 RepID=A0A6A6R1F6_9PEZI|nr:hypothetical protein BU16DRAFT_579389 [Lophium mytilinum]